MMVIFDLDGVLVDTAKFHYLAWKEVAREFGYVFSEIDNEAFKGVSRIDCMDMLCEMANLSLSKEGRERVLGRKNDIYLRMVEEDVHLLDGVLELLKDLKMAGVKMAVGSASKNVMFVLEKTGITDYFDAIVDGNMVTHAKPDPDVFVMAANMAGVECCECIVIEDAEAGVMAAKSAGMMVVPVALDGGFDSITDISANYLMGLIGTCVC
ncbi:MAG: beta-phosphoglucomutase [Epulopiscium sp. Nele67-Bin005]|nr:MAG: beta-phosphoglucomutase [Epulopiscium sp. Nele67-Bin005]